MDNSSIFVTPIVSVNFLPLFHYLNVLGDVLYAENLLTKDSKREPFLIINSLYEHLNRTQNETETRRQLVQKCLNGTDLYGGNKNETLDMEYINSTIDYIVSGVVFHHSKNLYGYLTSIVLISTDLKVSTFKKTVFKHLSYLRHLNDNGDVSKLTELSIKRIAETLIWPLFPESRHNISIISVEYIYALAGRKLAQSANMNLTDMDFRKYVSLGMTIEASVIGKKIPESSLQIFALPAIIYYAYKEKEKFNQRTIKYLIKNKVIWSDALFTLFSYLNSTFEDIRQEAVATNSLYQFHQVMSNFKNRTFIARDLLHKHCNHLNESYLESLIDGYKTFSASTICPNSNELIPKFLPNLEEVYDAQFYQIQEKYRLLELEFIRSAFDEFPHIRDSINSTNTTVYPSHPKMELYCYMCFQIPPEYKPNVHLFAIKQEEQIEFFALEQNENNVTLLLKKNSSKEFNKRVGLPQNTEQEIFTFLQPFKESGKDFKYFVEKFAEMRAKDFKKQLFDYGYDKTSMEKFFEIIESFIPFYNCVKHVNAGEQAMATFSCLGDVVSLIPFAGVLNVGFKISTITVNRFLLAAELSVKAYTFRQAILTTMTVGLRNAAIGLGEMFSKIVFTKQMFKTVSLGVIRTLDPGFELVGKLTLGGRALLGSVMKNSFKRISKNFPTLNFKFGKYESIWQDLTKNGVKPSDNFGIVSVPEHKVEGCDVIRFIYPGGNAPYGPKYIRLSKGFAELKQIIGFENKEIPVIASGVSKRGKTLYRRINLQTEEPFGLEMKLNKYNRLENVRQPFRQHIYKIKTEGLGGRGALMVKREKSITNAVRLITDANIGINKYQAEYTIRHYVLEVTDSPSIDDLLKTEVNFDKIGDFDVQNFIQEHITGIDGLSVIDTNLNQYLPVPTYFDFAQDWIRTGKIDNLYNEFYIKNPAELEMLLYNRRMLFNPDFDFDDAIKRLIAIYQVDDFHELHVDVSNAVSSYLTKNIMDLALFEDYYVLLVWKHLGYTNDIRNTVTSMQLQKSLYRLAIRQSCQELQTLSKVYFHLEVRVPLAIESELKNLIGMSQTSSKIYLSTSELEIYKQLIVHQSNDPVISGKQIFMYEVHIDSSYLAVNLRDLISTNEAAVLLPDVPYIIRNAQKKRILGHDIIYIVTQNKPIAKETVITKLMNGMDSFREDIFL